MAYKFKALEKDKENLKEYSQKNISANNAFGSYEIGDIYERTSIEIEKVPKIPVDKIKSREVNKFQTIKNDTLKASIMDVGLINPIAVKKNKSDYTIISGHRRFSVYKSIIADLNSQYLDATSEEKELIEKKIEFYSSIPAIIYEIVPKSSDLLGTDPKYITDEQEEKIYEAANLENRQISKKDLTEHILYFYNMIKTNPAFKKELLENRNKNAERQATKLNIPKALSDIITKDLGFGVAPSYIWSIVSIIEGESEYPAYHKIAMKRIKNGEKIKPIYKDFKMACEIYQSPTDDKRMKEEILTRLEKSDENVEDIYNEFFNIKPEVQEKKEVKKKDVESITKIFSEETDIKRLYQKLRKLGLVNKVDKYEKAFK